MKPLFESGPGAFSKGEFKEGSLIPGEYHGLIKILSSIISLAERKSREICLEHLRG